MSNKRLCFNQTLYDALFEDMNPDGLLAKQGGAQVDKAIIGGHQQQVGTLFDIQFSLGDQLY